MSRQSLSRGARLVSTCVAGLLLCGGPVGAQIEYDGTMGPSGIPAGSPDFLIPHTDGTTVGDNLFHSFGHFNIGSSESATFTGPVSIDNIISRVTGGSTSTIDGLLRTTGMPSAGFFLINPAGVIFGPGAQIDVPAAFAVTTANLLEMGDPGRFAATIDPADSVLTTAPPSAFGFLDGSPQPIQLDSGTLEVGLGQAISLVGGDLEITGRIAAPSGRINLMSVASPGTVQYDPSNHAADLNVNDFTALGSVDKRRGTGAHGITVAGDPGGTIVIRGGQLLLEGDLMTAQTQGAADHPGIGVDIHLTGDLILQGTATGAAEIACSSASGATGNAGDTQIVAGSLELTGDPTSGYDTNIGSRAFGAGDAGDLTITADSVALSGPCFISAPALSTGHGGNITINAGTVELNGQTAYTYISSLSAGGGNAGTVDITADSFVARGGPGGYVGVSTQTNVIGTGTPGHMSITSDTFQLLDGAQLNAGMFSSDGIGGNIVVDAGTAVITGYNPYGYPSGVFASAGEPGADPTVTGYGGTVRVIGGSLELSNWGQLGVWTTGRGNAGNVVIDTDSVAMYNHGMIFANTWAGGDGGDVSITADVLDIRERSLVTLAANSADPGADAGSLDVTAQTVRLTGPASSTDPFGYGEFTGFYTDAWAGRGGDVQVTADSLVMDSRAAISTSASGAQPSGNVDVTVSSLGLLGGSIIHSSTYGSGLGGTVTVTADDVLLSGVHPDSYWAGIRWAMAPSAIASEAGFGGGNAGEIDIDTGRLSLFDGAVVSTTTVGLGNAGTTQVTADSVLVSGSNAAHEQFLKDQGLDPKLARSSIASSALNALSVPDPVTGDAGTVGVEARELTVTDRGLISSSTETSGNGGSIVLDVGDLHVTDGGEIASSSTGTGNAGTITVDAFGSIGLYGGGWITTSADQANAGSFMLTAGDDINLDRSSITARAALDGGNIELIAGDTVDLFYSLISTQAGGTGGNITIRPAFTILDHAQLIADASRGSGGNILIDTDTFLESHSKISASSEYGLAGTIEITSPFADLAGTLALLAESLLSADVQLADPCVTRFLRGASSFVVTGREGLPMEPGAWLPSLELRMHRADDEGARESLR